jgi:hypothetical protein
MKRLLLIACLLNAASSAVCAPQSQAQPVVPVRIFNADFDTELMSPSSYENFKHAGVTFHQSAFEWHGGAGRSYGHFVSAGQLDLFVGGPTYNPGLPLDQATPSWFLFEVLHPDGYWEFHPELIRSEAPCIPDPEYPQFCYAPGCIHPRKALTADFNADGKPDVFVACHGYDAPPFPGERNRIVLSQPDGKWWVQDASDDAGFFHGASSADLNGDPYPDVVVTNGNPEPLIALINDGYGHFTRENPNQRFPALGGGYYTVELMDVDGDGLLDLVAGGHEQDGAETFVSLNPGNYDFRNVLPVTIPAIAGQGVVLDFAMTATGGQRVLWVSRTSDGQTYGVNAYTTRVVQKVTWPGLVSTVPLLEDPGPWVTWLIAGMLPDGRQFVSPDIAVEGFQLVQ